MSRPRPRRRTGFTLIELLVVIVVISILIALLVPAIMGAIRTANDARVRGEIEGLGQSLASFKEKYGSYPPSRILLHEGLPFSSYTGAMASAGLSGFIPEDTSKVPTTTWLGGGGPKANTNPGAGNDVTMGQLAQRSALYMQRFFPKAAIVPPDQTSSKSHWYDFNGNGNPDYTVASNSTVSTSGWIYLEGHECLVFFLGGIPTASTDANGVTFTAMAGFGKDPSRPFTTNGDPAVGGSAQLSLSRTPSFFEWKSERLKDEDGDGIPGYFDALSTASLGYPYAYFSAYDGSGYDPNDMNVPELSPSGVGPISRIFRVGLGLSPLSSSNYTTLAKNTIESASPNPYTAGLAVPDATGVKPANWQNPNTFQIISGGRDQLYGVGGAYTTTGNENLPDDGLTNPAKVNLRVLEQDNLTNFANSKLQ